MGTPKMGTPKMGTEEETAIAFPGGSSTPCGMQLSLGDSEFPVGCRAPCGMECSLWDAELLQGSVQTELPQGPQGVPF